MNADAEPRTTRHRAASRPSVSARRQQILDTATAVLADKGIGATTVRDISEQAGILSGSLYHHFTSKEQMISEILVPVVQGQIDVFDRIVATTDDPTEILRQVIAGAIAQTAANPAVARILLQDRHHIAKYAGLEDVRRKRRELRDRLNGVVLRGVAAGQLRSDIDPEIATTVLFDAVLGAYRFMEPAGEHAEDALTEQLTTLTLSGLLAR